MEVSNQYPEIYSRREKGSITLNFDLFTLIVSPSGYNVCTAEQNKSKT